MRKMKSNTIKYDYTFLKYFNLVNLCMCSRYADIKVF